VKIFDIKSLKSSVTLYIAIAMLLLTTTAILSTLYVQNHHAKIEEKKYNNHIRIGIEHIIKHYIGNYAYKVRRMLESKNIAKYMKTQNREALYNYSKPKWDLMIEGDNLAFMHFHLADGSSFLRMHKPELYGDNLTNIRPMLKEIHEKHQEISGYETGKYATAYRFLSPIFDTNKEYIGAIEIGIDPQFILNAVHEINGFCGMMFIKQDSLLLDLSLSDTVIDGYTLQSKVSSVFQTQCDMLKVLKKLENGMKIEANDKVYKTHLFALSNYEDQEKVKIIFFQDISDFIVVNSGFVFGIFLFLGMVFVALVWLVYRRISLYQNEVSAIYEKQIQKLNASEHRFELLYKKAPKAYQSLDEEGNILIVNTKWCEDLGYEEQEVIGKNFSEFLAPAFKSKFQEYFLKFKDKGIASGIELDMVTKDAAVISVSFNGQIVRDEENNFMQTHCIFSNITAKKILREKMAYHRKYLQNIFDINPNIMLATNGYKAETTNPAMLSFFDYKSLEAFHAQHECICDFFLKEDGCLESEVEGINWLEYILQNPSQLNRVCMLKDEKKHYFTIKAQALEVGESAKCIVFFNDVTEIEKISEQLEYAVKGTNDGLWDWNIEENSVYFSPRWKKMLGYEDKELKNVFETWESRVHPDDLQRVTQAVQQAQKNPDLEYVNTHRICHKDGHWVWVLDRGKTIFDKNKKAIRMVGFHTDITEIKELEDELRVSKQNFEKFMEYMPGSIIIKDENLRILYANETAKSFFAQRQIVGLKCDDLLGKEDAQKVHKLDEKILKENFIDEIEEYINDKNKKKIFRTMGFVIEDSGVKKLGIIIVDITNEYEMKAELHNKEELMIAQSRQAAMGEMISMIAHQWRQPISVISMDANNILVDIELENLDAVSLKKVSQDIIYQTQELSKTIDDFRNFFKPDKEAHEILVKELFNSVLGIMSKSLENSQIEFYLELDETIKITTYERELVQVFVNIVKNSKEALVERKIQKKKISVITQKDTEYFILRFCDNAGGIEDEYMKNIFNPYFTTKSAKNGTGLGLYMSKTIVEKHLDGSLIAENSDEGACIVIKIPYVLGEKDD